MTVPPPLGGPPEASSAAEDLALLGLGPDEAAIYLYLLREGPSKPADVALALRLSRPEAYRFLERMVRRGFAVLVLGRPARYEPVPFDRLFAQVERQHVEQGERLGQARRRLDPVLQALRAEAGQEPSWQGRIRVAQGPRESAELLKALLDHAEEEVRSVSLHPGVVQSLREAPELWVRGVQRAEEGLAIRAVFHTAVGEALGGRLFPPQFEMRFCPEPHPARFVLGDTREALVWTATERSQRWVADGDVVAWTDAPDLIDTLGLLFDYVWRDPRCRPLDKAPNRSRNQG